MSRQGSKRKRFALSLTLRLSLVVAVLFALLVVLLQGLNYFFAEHPWRNAAVVLVISIPAIGLLMHRMIQPMLALFRALTGTVISYQDKDYSFSVRWSHDDELRALVDAHNELGKLLRSQRLDLVQRELLLDAMVQNTPVAMLLISDGRSVVYANIAARQMLNQGRKLEGHTLDDILEQSTTSLREAVARGGDGLFTVNSAEDEDVFHLSRRQFSLNGRKHELLLLRQLTAELRRQEVQTWKKVIRVISHELNNSLAPIASLARSSAELLRRNKTERLPELLETIEERAHHLETFILGYARFAKLPSPQLKSLYWPDFISRLRDQIPFQLQGALPDNSVQLDHAQMEQALLNLLKNAHESGSAPDAVCISVRTVPGFTRIDVMDRGTGMSETSLVQALLPFYSTKHSGTGLGLALAREIAEAHGGRISLNNRDGGGVQVTMTIPSG